MRFVREDVEARANPPRDEFRHECLLVNDLTPRGVDETGPVREQSEVTRVDQPARFGCQRRVDRDDVRFAQQLVELPVFAEPALAAASLRVEHAKLEAARTSRHGLPDTPEAD